MANEVGVGYVSIVPSTKGFGAKLAAEGAAAGAGAGAAGGKSFGKAFGARATTAGKGLTKGLTLPLLAVGVAGVAAAAKVDKGMQQVIRRTGATGAQIGELEQSFKNVASNATQDMEEVGAVIGEVNTRLGLQGEALETTSEDFLTFARVAGVDAESAVVDVTRAMGDWGVEAADATMMMDKLTKASQLTGIGVDELAKQMTDVGSPMRTAGFSMEQVVAMLAKFHKEGVVSEKVTSGLRMALGRLAKEGVKDVPAEMARLITKIKETKDESEAAAIAVELFGSRNAVDMAAAIREGRLEIDDLVNSLNNSQGALQQTAADSETTAEKWDKFKNKMMLAGAQIGDAIMPVLDKIADLLSKVAEWFTALPEPVQQVVIAAGLFAAAIGPVIAGVGMLTTAVMGLNIAFLANPITWIIAAIVALGAILVYAWNEFEWFREGLQSIWDSIMEAMQPVVDWFRDNWDQIKDVLVTAFKVIAAVIAGSLFAMWKGIEVVVKIVAGFIKGLIWWWQHLYEAIRWVWDAIWAVVETQVNNIRTVIEGATRAILWVWENVFIRIWDIAVNVFNGIRNVIENVVGWIQTAVEWLSGIIDAIMEKIGPVIDVIGNVAGGVGDFFGGVFHSGGTVPGTGDVPIIAQGGEVVMNRRAATAIGYDNLNRANRGDMAGLGAAVNYSITVNNPRPEPASESLPNAVRKSAYLAGVA
jgi:TP901 family phage tail tape measure protein